MFNLDNLGGHMREHYIIDKVYSLQQQQDLKILDRKTQGEHNQNIKRLANSLTAQIEKATEEFHAQLCGYVYHLLEKELQ